MKTMRCGMKLFHEKVAGKFPKAKFLANLKTILGLVLVALLASGCGDNGGGGGYSDVLEGTFVDSPVEGLEYQTETQSGMTDENGAFVYMDGEIVTFHVGDIVLGEAIAHSMMTPVDLVDGAMDETHPMVTNMARLLQTLDADMDPDNGITITEQMAAAMFDHTIDFNMDPGTFEHDPNVQMFMDTLNGLDPSSPMRMMVSAEDAQSHLHNTLMEIEGMEMMKGTFLDSAVEGLGYDTETQSGVTDIEGTFMYMEGETITFHIGDIVLGETLAQPVMTPVDLVDGATDETHPMVTNMARLLQTLDADMDPDNGITITEQMAAAMFDHAIDFNMDPGTFEHDPNVQMFMDTLNGLDPSSPMRMMVSAEDAQNHLYNTLSHMMSGDSGIMDDDDTIKGDMIPENSDMMTYDTGMMSSGSGMMR